VIFLLVCVKQGWRVFVSAFGGVDLRGRYMGYISLFCFSMEIPRVVVKMGVGWCSLALLLSLLSLFWEVPYVGCDFEVDGGSATWDGDVVCDFRFGDYIDGVL
jgi:hypothetical protein